MNPLSLFKGQLWKVATVITGILSIGLVSLLLSSYFENRDLLNQRTELVKAINDPKTGYVAQLTQARTNVVQLEVALDTQRHSFEAKAAEREAVLARTAEQLAVAQQQTRAMEKRLSSFLATKPKGATLEERIRDIDARGMKEMVK